VTFPNPATYEFPEWILLGDYAYFAREVVSFGDPLTIENVRDAYTKGIFPWHMDGIPLPWYCPERRAVLDFADLHIPKSLERARRRNEFTFTLDKAFRSVIEECSRSRRPGQRGTWITPLFIETYSALHDDGMAHSVEVWDSEGEIVGGVYGVDAGGVFCGESMFYKEPNASKLALLFLIDHLRSRGSTWFDAQVMTPHIRALGAKEISRKAFLQRLRETQAQDLVIFDHGHGQTIARTPS
jgi:leucyl/phenylalanyl-tRNA--protein transferase